MLTSLLSFRCLLFNQDYLMRLICVKHQEQYRYKRGLKSNYLKIMRFFVDVRKTNIRNNKWIKEASKANHNEVFFISLKIADQPLVKAPLELSFWAQGQEPLVKIVCSCFWGHFVCFLCQICRFQQIQFKNRQFNFQFMTLRFFFSLLHSSMQV